MANSPLLRCGWSACVSGANVLPLPGERKSARRGNFRSSRTLVRVDEEFLAGGALVVDGDVGELQRLLQRYHLGVMAGKGGLEFGDDARPQLGAVGLSDLHQERKQQPA